MIYREDQERYVPIKFGVRKRDLAGAVREAQAKVAAEVQLPEGYRLEWVGQFRDLTAALERLAFIVPLSIGVIYCCCLPTSVPFATCCWRKSAMPLALIGGVYALGITGTPFSVSAAIGFVGLFGIAVMEGILILLLQPPHRRRGRKARRDPRRLQGAIAPGRDDVHRRLRWPPCLRRYRAASGLRSSGRSPSSWSAATCSRPSSFWSSCRC